MQPSELETIRHVYEEIVSMPWFIDDSDCRSDFGAALIRAFDTCHGDIHRLRKFGLDLARTRFSKAGPLAH